MIVAHYPNLQIFHQQIEEDSHRFVIKEWKQDSSQTSVQNVVLQSKLIRHLAFQVITLPYRDILLCQLHYDNESALIIV